MLKSKSFNVCKNTVVPMIVILGCLEVNLEISSTDMKTTESDSCREVLGDNRDTNGILAVI